MGEECVWKLSFVNRIVCWSCNVCRTAIFSDGACVGQFLLQLVIHYLAPVVQTFNSAILRINHYPGDKYYGNQLRYPADSDLSCGYRYPTFEQPGPDVFFFCVDETEAVEKKESLEEKRVSLPKLRPPYAQIPSSASTKLKTVYEALASQQSLMTEELYESSSESSSPFRSLEGRYQRTRVVFSLKTTFKSISS